MSFEVGLVADESKIRSADANDLTAVFWEILVEFFFGGIDEEGGVSVDKGPGASKVPFEDGGADFVADPASRMVLRDGDSGDESVAGGGRH